MYRNKNTSSIAPDSTSKTIKAASAPKLQKEIESWRSFSGALRAEDRELFRDMTSKLWEYADAVENSSDETVTESLLLSLLLSQQKIINALMARLLKKKEENAATEDRSKLDL